MRPSLTAEKRDSLHDAVATCGSGCRRRRCAGGGWRGPASARTPADPHCRDWLEPPRWARLGLAGGGDRRPDIRRRLFSVVPIWRRASILVARLLVDARPPRGHQWVRHIGVVSGGAAAV